MHHVPVAPPAPIPMVQDALDMVNQAERRADESRVNLSYARAEVADLQAALRDAETALTQAVHERNQLDRQNLVKSKHVEELSH